MNFDFYVSGSGGGDWAVTELAKSFGKTTRSVFDENPNSIAVSWGILRGSEVLIKRRINQNKPFVYIDHAYFNSGHLGEKSYYRIVKNELQLTRMNKVWKKSDKRLDELGIELKPWKKKGETIIICPPTKPIANFYDLDDNWVDMTITKISQLTDRPVIVRRKPGEIDIDISKGYAVPIINNENEKAIEDKSFDELLSDAYCVITFNSSVAIKSVMEGIPVIVDNSSAASMVGRNRISDIDDLNYPERWDWVKNLAYGQFSIEEMRTGRVWGELGF